MNVIACAEVNPLTFGDLHIGECFRRIYGGSIYMKIETLKTGHPCVVTLHSGQVFNVSPDLRVQRVRGHYLEEEA